MKANESNMSLKKSNEVSININIDGPVVYQGYQKDYDHMAAPLPVEAEPVFESSFDLFAKNTTFHGFNHMAGAKSKVRKATWCVAITIAFTVLIILIGNR